MQSIIYEKLKEYSKSDFYPFHMPGHKRRFDYEIPQAYIDVYNKEDSIYRESLEIVDAYKEMMKINEEVLKLSKKGDNNAN